MTPLLIGRFNIESIRARTTSQIFVEIDELTAAGDQVVYDQTLPISVCAAR